MTEERADILVMMDEVLRLTEANTEMQDVILDLKDTKDLFGDLMHFLIDTGKMEPEEFIPLGILVRNKDDKEGLMDKLDAMLKDNSSCDDPECEACNTVTVEKGDWH